MNTDALVSVIIPCKDGAAFLEVTLRSALAQTYPKVEIVVVDDGSTDGSSEIAQRFPIRYISQQNRGISQARNTGIWASRGSCIVFLDADDRLRPEAIEIGLRVLAKFPECVMAVGDHVFVSEDGCFHAASNKRCLLEHHYEALLNSNFVEMISSVLFRRRVLEEFAGFNPTLCVAEDYELYLRIARAHPICCHPVVVAEYRMRRGSMSRNPELMLTSTLQVLRGQARYIRSIGRLVAFEEGIHFWRKHYGRQLASELAKLLPTLSGGDLARKLFLLGREYPQGLVILVLLRIVSIARRRRSTLSKPTTDRARGELTYLHTGTGGIEAPHRDVLSKRNASGLRNAREATMPLVSVVITCYNSACYLAEAITSAIKQTYARIEIIVIDDGSADTTASIARSYPVTYIYQENQGVSGARNTGISHSRGKYVLFLDHDDRLLPEAIEVGVRLLEQHPECAMAVGEHRYIGANGTLLGCSNKHAIGRNHYLMLLEHNFIETPCSVLHRCSALPGVFDKSVNGAEDYEIYLRIARQSEFIVHAVIVSEYRLHDSSLSRNAERMMLASYRVLQMELPHLRSDRAKLRHYDRGVRFVQRHFGRQLVGELIHKGCLTNQDERRKLGLLRSHYFLGFVAVILSRLLPTCLLNNLILHKRKPTGLSYSRAV